MWDNLWQRDEATSGLLTDAAHKYFDKGYLIITSSHHQRADRWLPVLMTYSTRQSDKAYEFHFRKIFEMIADKFNPVVERADFNLMCPSTMDFSRAQSNAFVAAYSDVVWRRMGMGSQ